MAQWQGSPKSAQILRVLASVIHLSNMEYVGVRDSINLNTLSVNVLENAKFWCWRFAFFAWWIRICKFGACGCEWNQFCFCPPTECQTLQKFKFHTLICSKSTQGFATKIYTQIWRTIKKFCITQSQKLCLWWFEVSSLSIILGYCNYSVWLCDTKVSLYNSI